ncbi:MAG: hypothetical protein AAGE96_21295 [Cyanobacteria bacterium P01_G01_bin.19]
MQIHYLQKACKVHLTVDVMFSKNQPEEKAGSNSVCFERSPEQRLSL